MTNEKKDEVCDDCYLCAIDEMAGDDAAKEVCRTIGDILPDHQCGEIIADEDGGYEEICACACWRHKKLEIRKKNLAK